MMVKPQRVCVKEIMRDAFVILDGISTVAEAMEVASDKRAEVIVIKKRDEFDEYGIVLLSDIAKQVIAKDKAPDRVNLYEIMAKPMVSVHPGMDVRYCARLFENLGLSKGPVLDGDEVVGMVSYTDIVKGFKLATQKVVK